MANANRKRKKAVREQQEAKKFWTVVGVSVAVILILLFIGFMNA